MIKKLKKKRKPRKNRKQKIEFLAETRYGLIYLETPLNKLAKTILAIRKQLTQVEEKEKKASLGEI